MTALLALVSPPAPPEHAGRVLLRGISWGGYRMLLEEVRNSAVHLTYDDGLLEIEAPSRRHEELKKLVAALVEAALDAAGVDYQPLGSTTWNRQELLKGIEADDCYYVENVARIRGQTEIDLATDPPPDLAIEVEITQSALNKLRVYAALQVPEVWRVREDASLQVLRRGAAGAYEQATESGVVRRVTLELLQQHLKLLQPPGQVVHSTVLRQFRAAIAGANSAT